MRYRLINNLHRPICVTSWYNILIIQYLYQLIKQYSSSKAEPPIPAPRHFAAGGQPMLHAATRPVLRWHPAGGPAPIAVLRPARAVDRNRNRPRLQAGHRSVVRIPTLAASVAAPVGRRASEGGGREWGWLCAQRPATAQRATREKPLAQCGGPRGAEPS